MIIVLDSNIWLGELSLHSATGSALRFFIKKKTVRVVLPEVVRLEVQRNIRDRLLNEVKEIRRKHRSLLAYFGRLPEIVLPSEEEIVDKANDLFNTFNINIEDVPFSLDSARSSLLKTIDGTPPSSPKNQQFKDGVIWADCMDLLSQDDVTLVTQDKGFYRAGDPKQGLADNLVSESNLAKNKFKIMESLPELLDVVRDPIQVDGEAIAASVSAASDIASFIDQQKFAVGEILSIRNKLFATENPDVLLFQYEIDRGCLDISGHSRSCGKIVLTGSGSYNYSTRMVEGVTPGRATLSFLDPDGTAKEFRMSYASAHMHIGHKTVEYQERSYALTT
jgi:hypothetical protein